MGFLAPSPRKLDGVAFPPINMSKKMLTQLSANSPSNISPNPSEVIPRVLEPKDSFWKSPQLSAKIYHKAWEGGVPELFLWSGILRFFGIRAHAISSGRINKEPREKARKRILLTWWYTRWWCSSAMTGVVWPPGFLEWYVFYPDLGRPMTSLVWWLVGGAC